MHNGHGRLSSRGTTERLTKIAHEYEGQIERVLHVNTDAQHYDVA